MRKTTRGAVPAPPRLAGRGSTARIRLRTQTAAVVAWAAGAAALAAALYPTLAAALFAFLAGVVMVVTIRTSLRGGLAACMGAAVPFAFADLQLSALGGAGTSHEVVASLLLGLGLLPASAAVADAASTAISRLPAEPSLAREPGPIWTERATLSERDAGLRRAEWELARAAEYHREVALALVGLDVPTGGDDARTRLGLMQGLDELVLDSVTRFDVVCEHGPCERLMVLPEESVASLVDGASQICALATERLGRNVRMALAGFPDHGSTLRALLTELELDLTTCRMHGITVQVCSTAPPRASEAAPEPLVVLEPEQAVVEADGGGTVMSA
jgi:hypothetical protein